jgi:predicted transposase YbfD/YdcC
MNGQEMSEFNELKIKEDFTGFMSSNNKLNSRNKIVLKTFIELLDTYSLSDLLEENSKVKKELENGVFDLVKNNADALSKVLKNIEYFEGYFKEWKGLKKIFAIKREIEKNENKTTEISCYLSSKDTNAENLMKYTRNHWKIESMHHILDVTYDEDRCKLLTQRAQENLNIFRKMGISIHKKFLGV